MIWVLLEITLPLCLAFLFGLGAGWLFWRWRRRTVTQQELNKNQANPEDTLALTQLQQAHVELQQKSELLEATVGRQLDELSDAEEQIQTLTAGLKNTSPESPTVPVLKNNHLASLQSDSSLASADSSKPESGQSDADALINNANTEKQNTKIQELEFKSHNLETTIEKQTNELSETKKHIKKLSAELKSADQQLAALKGSTDAEDLLALQSRLSTLSTEKSEIEARCKEATADAKLKNNVANELKSKTENLETSLAKKSDELLEANKRAIDLSAESKAHQEKLDQLVVTHQGELQQVKSGLTQASEEITMLKQQLNVTTTDASEKGAKAESLAVELTAMQSTVADKENKLSESSQQAQQLADELKVSAEEARNLEKKSTAELNALQDELAEAKSTAATNAKKLQVESSRASMQTNLVAELQAALEKLEETAHKQSKELADTDNKFQLLSSDLKAALEKLAHESHQNAEAQQAADAKHQSAQQESRQLEKKLEELSARSEQQTKSTNELQQKLKHSETAATERDAAIEKLRQLQDQLSTAEQTTQELLNTKLELNKFDQKFKSFQSSVVASRQTAEAERAQLQTRIEELQQLLDEERENSAEHAATKQLLQQTEAQLTHANNASRELNQAKSQLSELNKKLNESRMDLAQSKDIGVQSDQQQGIQINKQNADLYHQLQQAKKDNAELRNAHIKFNEVTSQLNNAKARNNHLAAELAKNETAADVTPISVGQIKKLRAVVGDQKKVIAQLEEKLSSRPKSPKTATKKEAPAWQKGVTKLGTPGADHKDDLTVINGIGPKIEKTLNRLGIKSWQQLATFKAADIKTVDEALVDFSGRIQRDKWVPQARAIIRNGPKTADGSAKKSTAKSQSNKGKTGTKKAAKSTTGKKAWQKGKTKFGTPGSLHQDDLKVINGIGPVIEQTLNEFGIKSWEQLATLKVKEVKVIDEALDFPGRIDREQWVSQAKALVKQFRDFKQRPTRRTFLNQAAAR